MNRIFLAVAVALATCVGSTRDVLGAMMVPVPGVNGTVFRDINMGGGASPGEGIPDVAIELYKDDGNGVFDAADEQVGGPTFTGPDGFYQFMDLDADANYFAVRPAQNIGSLALSQDVSALLMPGVPNLVIDEFENNQIVKADPYTPIATSTLSDSVSSILGHERDMYVRLISGIGEVQLRTNAFGVAVIQYDNTSGVVGNGILTWDGEDMSASPVPTLGLGDVDLTEDGLNTGIFFRLGIDSTGKSEELRIRLYDDDPGIYSEGIIQFPVTDGTAKGSAFLAFSDITGPVSPSKVNAIQIWFGEDSPSIDAQIDVIGAMGPVQQNFEIVPEPNSFVIMLIGLTAWLALRRRREVSGR